MDKRNTHRSLPSARQSSTQLFSLNASPSAGAMSIRALSVTVPAEVQLKSNERRYCYP
jgi:hypothetical protein